MGLGIRIQALTSLDVRINHFDDFDLFDIYPPNKPFCCMFLYLQGLG